MGLFQQISTEILVNLIKIYRPDRLLLRKWLSFCWLRDWFVDWYWVYARFMELFLKLMEMYIVSLWSGFSLWGGYFMEMFLKQRTKINNLKIAPLTTTAQQTVKQL
jgi:hypothetical protein